MCVCESAGLISAPQSPQHQMDPGEIAREKIKNNSCQISERSEREEKEEEDGGGGKIKTPSVNSWSRTSPR